MAKLSWKERRKLKMRTRSKPLTLDALKEYGAFKGVEAPSGPFDPNGSWDQMYKIWLVASGTNDAGHMRLKRTAAGDGTVTLEVDQTIMQSAGTHHVTRASIQSRGDALAQPTAWTIMAALNGFDSKPIEDTVVKESAVVAGDKVTITAGPRTFVRNAPAPFTSDWSLIDVVQRLPGKATQPLSFTLLETLDLVKPGHTLSYREAITFDFNGAALKLDVYDHLGRGVLPERFFVDEQRRVVFAISGIRAYILHPGAARRTQERIKWHARKQKRSQTQ